MSSKTLIIGCGYIGLPLALRLKAQGHEVSVWVHSSASAASLAEHHFKCIIVGSIGDPLVWETFCEEPYGLAIHCASSGRGGPEAYQEVFLKGGSLMNQHLANARRLFVSSTSVYGQTDGKIVTEETPATATTMTGKILVMAEASSLASGATVIRSSGIYGPGRGVLFEKLQKGEAVIEGDGLRWINQIHRDDLVSAMVHLIDAGEPGAVYNATDNTPVTYNDYYAWCSEFLQKPMPPHGPINPNRKRGLTNKRVSNAKLRATGWQPHYSSFREGLAAIA